MYITVIGPSARAVAGSMCSIESAAYELAFAPSNGIAGFSDVTHGGVRDPGMPMSR
jgi:hypothetical protein